MKIDLLQENLRESLSHLQKVVPTKPSLPILSAILIQAQNGIITLSATDLYLGMTTTVAGVIHEEGVVAVPGKLFREAIASLTPGKLTLQATEEAITISSNRTKTTLQCLASSEFPDFPTLEGKQRNIQTEEIVEIDKLVGFATSLDPTRPVLTSLLFSFEPDILQVVGTDGFRLGTLSLSQQQEGEELGRLLIPAKAVSEVARLASTTSEKIVGFQVSQELKQVLFSIGNTQVFVRLIEGDYPPFEKIIPASFVEEVIFDAGELETLLKQALVFARESSNIVKISLNGDEATITALSPSQGQQEGSMKVERLKGTASEIAFNIRYLLEFLSSSKAERVYFGMNESLTPALLRPEGKEKYRYVAMPFRVSQ